MEQFKDVYKTFFSYGDSENFAHYAFRAFDIKKDKIINFHEFMCFGVQCVTLGAVESKLEFAFSLYDKDGDEFITQDEFLEIVLAL